VKSRFYLNFYIHWVAIVTFIIGLLGAFFSESINSSLNLEDLGLMSVASYFYLFIYQFVVSLVGVLIYRSSSIFYKQFIAITAYIIVYITFISYAFEPLLQQYDYPGIMIMALLPSFLLLCNFIYITFTSINPITLYNRKHNVFEI